MYDLQTINPSYYTWSAEKYVFSAGWEVRRYETVTEVLRAEGSIFMARIAVFHPIEREITFLFVSSLYLKSILLPAASKGIL